MSPSLFFKLALGALAVPSAVFAIPTPAPIDRRVIGETSPIGARAPSLKILIGNDDGWAEGNIRQLYDDTRKAGHNVALSAGAKNGSGSSSLNIAFGTVTDSLYNTIPRGAPQAGFNQTDPRLNYFNGTPVAAIANGFKELPNKFWGGAKPDIVLSGPNVGSNLGAITLFSGTVGVASFAAGQGVPAIAFSAGDDTRVPFTALQAGDAAHVYSQLAMTITNRVTSSTPFLPEDVLLNVNFPKTSAQCSKPEDFKFVFTTVYPLAKTIGCTESVRTPAEADVIAAGACLVSISAMGSNKFDVDTAKQTTVFNKLSPILSCADVKDHILSAILPLGTVLGRRDELEDGVAGTVQGAVDTL
ncbi:hypothetical protein FRC01_000255 [Tulasnella sp. 417]|nr:hypothetical protein FRC01_000255 [Tulasnella sp. 417]